MADPVQLPGALHAFLCSRRPHSEEWVSFFQAEDGIRDTSVTAVQTCALPICFIGFAIGESLGAAALRVAGGIFTKIADIGSDLMKIAFKIKEDDARNPGVIADCTGDNAGDSVGPSAVGFETYGVTGVALI